MAGTSRPAPIRVELTLSRDVELRVCDEVTVLRDAAGVAHPVPAGTQVRAAPAGR